MLYDSRFFLDHWCLANIMQRRQIQSILYRLIDVHCLFTHRTHQIIWSKYKDS